MHNVYITNYRRTHLLQGNHNHNSRDRASGSCGCRVLEDFKVNGKSRPWRERKAASRAVGYAFQCIAEDEHDETFARLGERVKSCGQNLEFARIKGPNGTRKRLTSGMFCKVRLCPVCQWRRAQESARQLGEVVTAHWEGAEAWGEDGVEARLLPSPKDRALFLTLTAKSVSSEDLPAEISRFYRAFDRMRRAKRFMGFCTSWFRALEITYNPQTRLYHPHWHVMLMVKPEYFTNPEYYLDQSPKKREWSKLWGWALDVDYVPVVDIRVLKGSQYGRMNDDVRKSLRELTKYCTKPEGFIDLVSGEYVVNPSVLKALHESLRGRRLFGWGGKFKEARKVLKLQDAESDDADLVGSEGLAEGEVIEALETYGWRYVPELKRADYILLHEQPPNAGGEDARGKAQRPPDRRERGEPQTPLHRKPK